MSSADKLVATMNIKKSLFQFLKLLRNSME